MCRDHKIEERETAWNGRETGVNAYSRAWTPILGRERLYTKNPLFFEEKICEYGWNVIFGWLDALLGV